ncbi:MAG: PAS domain S-box protein, partial [Comamonas sp.]
MRDQAREAGGAVEGRIIHPVLDRSEHHIVEYLWPREEASHLLGLDVGADPESLQALARARETGEPVASPPLDPAGARDAPRVFTLSYPVFDTSAPGTDGGPRFMGTVAATLGIDEMLDGLRFSGVLGLVALQWRDDGAVGAAPGSGASQWLGETADLGARWRQPGLRQEVTLQTLGRRWRLIYVPTQSLLSPAEAMLPRWMAGAGGTLSVLLALGAWLLLTQRARAAALVDEADARHRSSEQRLRAMFEQAAVGVAMIDMRTLRFERVNRKFCDMLGYTSEEMLKLSVSDVSHGRDAAVNDDLRDQLRQGKISAFHMEKCMLRKDGSEVWVDLTVAPVLRDGGLPQHNVGVIQDISERRAMREELQASEQRLRAILDHLPLGIAMWHSGRVVFRNRSFVQLTGYGDDIMMTGEQWWRMAYPNDAVRQRAQTRWKERTLRAKSHGGFVEWDEYEICCADGRMKPVGISGILLKSSQLFILEDLSQHKAAEDEINALAHYDALTGLANRRMLVERFGHALAAS